MKFTVRFQVLVDGDFFAECATRAEANRAFEQAAANPTRRVDIIELQESEFYEVEYA